METAVCLSSLKQKHEEILKEIGIKKGDLLALAIWEQIKNTEHRVPGTHARISLIRESDRRIIMTRNKTDPEEIIRHLDRHALSEESQLLLDDHRGEAIIVAVVGKENYQRFIDPRTLEMVTALRVPTNYQKRPAN